MAGKERGKKPSPLPLRFQQEEGKKRGQIGKISASEGSRAVAWGRRKNATLSLRQTGLSARFTRRFFFFFPQRGAWSQITWFLPLLLSLRFVILRYNSKYQSKGQIYILHLFAFQKKQQKQKTGFGKATKQVRDARMNKNAGSAPLPNPPLQTMTDANKVKLSVHPFNIEAIAHLNKRNV